MRRLENSHNKVYLLISSTFRLLEVVEMIVLKKSIYHIRDEVMNDVERHQPHSISIKIITSLIFNKIFTIATDFAKDINNTIREAAPSAIEYCHDLYSHILSTPNLLKPAPENDVASTAETATTAPHTSDNILTLGEHHAELPEYTAPH